MSGQGKPQSGRAQAVLEKINALKKENEQLRKALINANKKQGSMTADAQVSQDELSESKATNQKLQFIIGKLNDTINFQNTRIAKFEEIAEGASPKQAEIDEGKQAELEQTVAELKQVIETQKAELDEAVASHTKTITDLTAAHKAALATAEDDATSAKDVSAAVTKEMKRYKAQQAKADKAADVEHRKLEGVIGKLTKTVEGQAAELKKVKDDAGRVKKERDTEMKKHAAATAALNKEAAGLAEELAKAQEGLSTARKAADDERGRMGGVVKKMQATLEAQTADISIGAEKHAAEMANMREELRQSEMVAAELNKDLAASKAMLNEARTGAREMEDDRDGVRAAKAKLDEKLALLTAQLKRANAVVEKANSKTAESRRGMKAAEERLTEVSDAITKRIPAAPALLLGDTAWMDLLTPTLDVWRRGGVTVETLDAVDDGGAGWVMVSLTNEAGSGAIRGWVRPAILGDGVEIPDDRLTALQTRLALTERELIATQRRSIDIRREPTAAQPRAAPTPTPRPTRDGSTDLINAMAIRQTEWGLEKDMLKSAVDEAKMKAAAAEGEVGAVRREADELKGTVAKLELEAQELTERLAVLETTPRMNVGSAAAHSNEQHERIAHLQERLAALEVEGRASVANNTQAEIAHVRAAVVAALSASSSEGAVEALRGLLKLTDGEVARITAGRRRFRLFG